MRSSRLVAVLSVISISAALPAASPAATINVTTPKDQFGGGPRKCSLREAIQSANADSRFGGCRRGDGADTVELAKGTYELTRSQAGVEDANGEGDLDISEGMSIVGAGSSKTKVDGNGDVTAERVLQATIASPIRLSNLTIRGGREPSSYAGGIIAGSGGQGTLTIVRSTIRGNRSFSYGGGVVSNGPLRLVRSTVSGNHSELGGGILADASGSVRKSAVRGNHSNRHGGGIAGALTISDSVIAGNEAGLQGGGIYAESGDQQLVLRNTTVSGNRAAVHGGGFRAGSLGVSAIDSVIRGNEAGLSGGGFGTNGPLTLIGSSVRGNTAGSAGGGFFVGGAGSSISNSTVTGNRASGAGGGISASGALAITRTTISENKAGGGGGIHFEHATNPGLTVANSTISGNEASLKGGGLFVQIGANDSAFTNVTFSGNEAAGAGGGVFLAGGETRLKTVTITENLADTDRNDDGNGGGAWIEPAAGDTRLEDTVIADNRDLTPSNELGDRDHDCSGEVYNASFSLVRDPTGCAFGGGVGNLPDGTDPRLGQLHDNGGRTRTHAALVGSPLIDTGTPVGFPFARQCPEQDQRGAPREACDIGAYERVSCFGRAVSIVGTSGRNTLRGSNRGDVFLALGGNDRVSGRRGKDRACGGEGNDRLVGGDGNDRLDGGPGKDRLDGGPGRDVCIGGPGPDKARNCETTRSIP